MPTFAGRAACDTRTCHFPQCALNQDSVSDNLSEANTTLNSIWEAGRQKLLHVLTVMSNIQLLEGGKLLWCEHLHWGGRLAQHMHTVHCLYMLAGAGGIM
jgi:hypothetical protein